MDDPNHGLQGGNDSKDYKEHNSAEKLIESAGTNEIEQHNPTSTSKDKRTTGDVDLNVPWPKNNYDPPSEPELKSLQQTILTLYHLGYRYVAVNFEIDENLKLPVNSPSDINPIKLNQLINLDRYRDLNLYTRLTIIVNDSSKLMNFNKFQTYFNLISIKPMTEKALQLSIINLNIDLISINLASKLNFYLKHKIIGQALKKGIKFEICYNGLISSLSNSLNRKFFISNLIQLVRATRSNGLVLSSGCNNGLDVRPLNNVINFLETLGLKSKNINQYIANSKLVLVNGNLKINSYKQLVAIDDDPTLIHNGKDLNTGDSVKPTEDIGHNSIKQFKRNREKDSDIQSIQKRVKPGH